MIELAGHDRKYTVPERFAGDLARTHVTAWDLLQVADKEGDVATWADGLLASLLQRAAAVNAEALGDCDDCDDLTYFGVPSADDPDLLTELVREAPDGTYERLTASGWENYSPPVDMAVEALIPEAAAELASVIASGGTGLVLRFAVPVAWLPPSNAQLIVPITAAVEQADAKWKTYAIVDDLDAGAVINLVRLAAGPKLEDYVAGTGWAEAEEILNDLQGITPPKLVELDEALLASVIEQIDAGVNPDKEHYPDPVTAATSPDPRAEKLRRYWSVGGKGGLKIRWGTRGDWRRCRRYLAKYLGPRANGYCQNMHKRNTGVYTGSKLNASATWPRMSTEAAVAAAITAGGWFADEVGKVSDMKDGIYSEIVEDDREMIAAITAGAFPLNPPEEWFDDPQLEGPTPLTIEASGRVFGHIASFDVAHIGLPGKVHAPRSKSGYAFFHTGEVVTASGSKVSVGQLTLAGGHAPMNADAGQAVAHYDNTASAVVDIHVGEDKYGIWAAGAARPEVTPEQVRALRASAPSGDWRPINGQLELVAVCQVNVPGFPIARARVASGAVMALVAAGASVLAEQRYAEHANKALADKVAGLEAALIASGVLVDTAAALAEAEVEAVEEAPAEVEPEVEAPEPTRVEALRKELADKRRAALRDRVRRPESVAASVSE